MPQPTHRHALYDPNVGLFTPCFSRASNHRHAVVEISAPRTPADIQLTPRAWRVRVWRTCASVPVSTAAVRWCGGDVVIGAPSAALLPPVLRRWQSLPSAAPSVVSGCRSAPASSSALEEGGERERQGDVCVGRWHSLALAGEPANAVGEPMRGGCADGAAEGAAAVRGGGAELLAFLFQPMSTSVSISAPTCVSSFSVSPRW